MAAPAVRRTAAFLYEELGVTQPRDEALGWPFLVLLHGVATAMGQLPDVVRDDDNGPGWSALLDPDRCPAWALPWLAQFAGVELTPGADEAQQRAEITHPPAFVRGTVQAIKDAATFALTGGKHVTLFERDGDEWHLIAVTYDAETPDADAVSAAMERQTPPWLVFTHRVDPGWAIGQMEAAYTGQTIADLEADFPTIGDLEMHLPDA